MQLNRAVIVLISLLTVGIGGCTPKRATAVVLWIDTDIPEAAFGRVTVRVQGTGSSQRAMQFSWTHERTSAGPWPGSIVLAPEEGRGVTSADVTLHYEPFGTTNGTSFDQRATVVFAQNEWRQVTVLIANQCTDANIEARCRVMSVNGMEYTCGSNDPDNPCVRVQRESMPFAPDAGAPDATVRADVPMMDAPIDTDDASVDPASIAAPTLLFPPTGGRVRGQSARFKVLLSPGVTGAAVQVCDSPECDGVLDPPMNRLVAGASTGQLPRTATGEHFWWRAFGVKNGVIGTTPSNTRLFVTTAGAVIFPQGSSTIGRIADFDNDGHGDYVVGRPGRRTAAGGSNGAVNPFTTVADNGHINVGRGVLTPDSMPVGQHFGAAITACDFDGDGRTDLAVGAPGSTHDSIVGRVLVYKANSMSGVLPSAPTLTLMGAHAGDLFGFSLTAGDLNADGKCDLVVGAPGTILMGMSEPVGLVRIYAGHSSDTVVPAGTYTGTAAFEECGYSVSSGADVNGDGLEDLVIGAPGALARPGTPGTGKVFVWVSNGQLMSPGDRSYAISPDNTEIGARYGHSVAMLGDVDGDSFADIGVGAPGFNDSLGKAYVLRGAAAPSAIVLTLVTPAAISSNANFGWTMAGLGSPDRDDHDEIFVGAPGTSTGTAVIYRCFLCNGPVRPSTVILPGTVIGSRFGWAAAALGDITHDNTDDFIITAPYADDALIASPASASQGMVRAFFGVMGADPVAAPASGGQVTDPDMRPNGEWGSALQR
jgi:hypothetical protein